MAVSKCVSCGGASFELKEASPTGSRFKFHFIQCSKCGGVVGVVDYMHNGSEHNEIKMLIEDKNKKLANEIEETKEMVQQIGHYLSRLSSGRR
ncbi:hypothetical protein BK126_03035 [Paenibacillus sp. FSL H7-0326]|uniref:hypothetical protein n=1 Tax=Paenibacillus sp. FSL H7-0326 TaxID=1921144 RepID=UPI00096CF96C|nr:hypothetical protein [Paenibacillus sp. FSL H7-0326]OMC71102.1 hypothetical protein BK126_03035 [Paenibacillus sp. FSL H7-0326]